MGVGEIPSGIGRIGESLSVLSFNRNRRLQTVPPEVGQCINLALLYLADNAITSVPSELGRLTGLATLSLEGNTLSSLPVELDCGDDHMYVPYHRVGLYVCMYHSGI